MKNHESFTANSSESAAPEKRKRIWRDQLLRLRLFQDALAAIEQRPDHAIAGDSVREMIIIAMPREDYEAMFDTMVRWARFGNLFAYEEDADRLSLQQECQV